MKQEDIFFAISNKTSLENDAIKALYALYYVPSRNIAFRHNLSEDEAKCIFQEAIVLLVKKVWDRSFTFQNDCFKRFLLKVVKNKCLSQARKNNKNNYELPEKLSVDIESAMDDIQPKLIERIFEIAEANTKNGKEIIYRRFFLKEEYCTIAKHLGYDNPNSVKNGLYRVFLIIRQELNLNDFLNN